MNSKRAANMLGLSSIHCWKCCPILDREYLCCTSHFPVLTVNYWELLIKHVFSASCVLFLVATWYKPYFHSLLMKHHEYRSTTLIELNCTSTFMLSLKSYVDLILFSDFLYSLRDLKPSILMCFFCWYQSSTYHTSHFFLFTASNSVCPLGFLSILQEFLKTILFFVFMVLLIKLCQPKYVLCTYKCFFFSPLQSLVLNSD